MLARDGDPSDGFVADTVYVALSVDNVYVRVPVIEGSDANLVDACDAAASSEALGASPGGGPRDVHLSGHKVSVVSGLTNDEENRVLDPTVELTEPGRARQKVGVVMREPVDPNSTAASRDPRSDELVPLQLACSSDEGGDAGSATREEDATAAMCRTAMKEDAPLSNTHLTLPTNTEV